MKVRVDPDLCVGHGRCYVLAPDVFGADDYGHCEILVESPEGKTVTYTRGQVQVVGRLKLNPNDPENFLYTINKATVKTSE